jgi:hypothetical protein
MTTIAPIGSSCGRATYADSSLPSLAVTLTHSLMKNSPWRFDVMRLPRLYAAEHDAFVIAVKSRFDRAEGAQLAWRAARRRASARSAEQTRY